MAIPIVDLNFLPSADKVIFDPQIDQFCQKFRKVLETHGCCQFINHGIDKAVIDDVFRSTNEFFRLPEEIKTKYQRVGDVESYWGYYMSRRNGFRERYDIVIHGAHQFPTEVPQFIASFCKYSTQCNVLVEFLLYVISKCLGISDLKYFVNEHSEALTRGFKTKTHLSSIYYRNDKCSDHEYLMERHTDLSTMTLLISTSPGLQVELDGHWHDVDPMPGGILLHIGDLLEMWTAGKYRATVHRVSKLRGAESTRISIPYFIHPNASAVVKPLLNDNTGYQPVVAEEYWTEKMRLKRSIDQSTQRKQ